MISTPLFPGYESTRAFLQVLQGLPAACLRSMCTSLLQWRGTPKHTMSWANPDKWIDDRLSGDERVIARKIWIGSQKVINPRWIAGEQYLIKNYQLLEEFNGHYRLTHRGKLFLDGAAHVVREIDESEGLIYLLRLVAAIGKGKRSDFIQSWKSYLLSNSQVEKISVITDYLRHRLLNLQERGYLERQGSFYDITDQGRCYMKDSPVDCKARELDELNNIVKQLEVLNKQHRIMIRQYLELLDATQFEHLVKALLQKMGYADIRVTSPSNDKGIDVTAISQHGITTVKEVIQVKRFTKTNVQRPVLDGLRGCLHRYDAFQGTIITLSGFAKGAKDAAYEKGAAPITLIDGDKLIDMLVEKQLGVKQQQLYYLMVDEPFFMQKKYA
jgi:restriction system protein